MASNDSTTGKSIPSFMRGTANSSSKIARTTTERKRNTSQPQKVSSQARTSYPKSPARTQERATTVVSKTGPTSPSTTTRQSVSQRVGATKRVESSNPVDAKWERLMKLVPKKDCAVYPSPKKEKPTTSEEFEELERKGYYNVKDTKHEEWHIITVMLNYRMDELNEKWEVECPDGVFWVTFKDRDVDPVTKNGKWLVRAKIYNSDKWLHAYLIHKDPIVARDLSLTVTDEVVWAIGEYNFWDELPEWQ
ncbi:hypothetical protein LOD99_14308 [Oopsacas minuta]|uniref:Uncharacterized protein n=1 Tax=Oopsacas minuta TaxID=111878 RepID=A0AAV7KFA7_9METZ|nr:hypothetical protein LOD99_14308 [Oopsacas minuta]